ncbi:MAG: hypothetical protein ACTJHU_04055, partial [Mycetocola sp.]
MRFTTNRTDSPGLPADTTGAPNRSGADTDPSDQTDQHIMHAERRSNRPFITQLIMIVIVVAGMIGSVFIIGGALRPVDGAPSIHSGFVALGTAAEQIRTNAYAFVAALATIAVALTLSLTSLQRQVTQSAETASRIFAEPTRRWRIRLSRRRRPDTDQQDLLVQFMVIRRATLIETVLAAACAGVAALGAVVLLASPEPEWPAAILCTVLAVYIAAEALSSFTTHGRITTVERRVRAGSSSTTAQAMTALLARTPGRARIWFWTIAVCTALAIVVLVALNVGAGYAAGAAAYCLLCFAFAEMSRLFAGENLVRSAVHRRLEPTAYATVTAVATIGILGDLPSALIAHWSGIDETGNTDEWGTVVSTLAVCGLILVFAALMAIRTLGHYGVGPLTYLAAA